MQLALPSFIFYHVAIMSHYWRSWDTLTRLFKKTTQSLLFWSMYLSFVFRDCVVHLPSVLRKHLSVLEGKYLLGRGGGNLSAPGWLQLPKGRQHGWYITYQSVGDRKGKFHQHFENGLFEGVVHLFVRKSQITHILCGANRSWSYKGPYSSIQTAIYS